jgi:hypothetical protein
MRSISTPLDLTSPRSHYTDMVLINRKATQISPVDTSVSPGMYPETTRPPAEKGQLLVGYMLKHVPASSYLFSSVVASSNVLCDVARS